MTMHIFNVDDAVEHGMEKAVVLQNMRFWLYKNKANGTNLHDGYYWTYNSAEAFFKLFPYFKSAKVIQRLLKSMVEDGLLLASNYNKKGYDRTKWYSMPEYCAESLDTSHCSKMTNGVDKNDQCNGQNCPMDCSEMTNAMVKNDQPIPYVNTDIKPDDKPSINNPSDWIDESFESFYESYPNKKGRGQAQKTWNNVFLGKGDHKKPSNPVELFETIMSAVQTQTPEILLSAPQFRKHPSTWLNAQAWLDEVTLQPTQSPQATESYEPAFNGWNDRNPDYKPTSQQPDVYHPSQAEFQSPEPVTYVPDIGDPNWRWTEPLPGMSIIETDRYIKENKCKGENPNKAYQRLLAEMQGETV